MYCGNNPVNYWDPLGLEYVVVSGGEYKKDRGGDYNYEFIEPAIKKLQELKDLKDGENITWIIANEGWTDSDREKFSEVAENIGVSIKYITDKQELFDYINSKDDNTRYKDKIKKFVVFSHGLATNGGTISLGYNYSSEYNTSLNIDKNDIKKYLWATAFDNPNTALYSCNLATAGNDSFAQEWVNKFGGKTWAFVNRSEYSNINIGFHPAIVASRKLHGFSYYGSAHYPTLGNNATFNLYTSR